MDEEELDALVPEVFDPSEFDDEEDDDWDMEIGESDEEIIYIYDEDSSTFIDFTIDDLLVDDELSEESDTDDQEFDPIDVDIDTEEESEDIPDTDENAEL